MTDLSKSQLNAILSALDGQPRNPNTKDAALRRIGAHAERLVSASMPCWRLPPACSTAV